MNGLLLSPERILGISLRDTLVWWNEIALQIRGIRKACIKSWEELKQEMRERSVEEYFKEMEVAIIRAIVESQEATMAKFLCGLNKHIQDIRELYDYTYSYATSL
ncbi:hypothetical protein CR513_42413, partial [Mucuna pruriens]